MNDMPGLRVEVVATQRTVSSYFIGDNMVGQAVSDQAPDPLRLPIDVIPRPVLEEGLALRNSELMRLKGLEWGWKWCGRVGAICAALGTVATEINASPPGIQHRIGIAAVGTAIASCCAVAGEVASAATEWYNRSKVSALEAQRVNIEALITPSAATTAG